MNISQEIIESKVLLIRGQKVMLDRDLAILYRVHTGRLNEQVKRNRKRFPEDFMFQLTEIEMQNWISQIAISKNANKGLRKKPYAFTEHGILMLSSVLNSERAIQTNIAITRVFLKMKNMISQNHIMEEKLQELEQKIQRHETDIQSVFEVLHQFLAVEEEPRRKIGFHQE